MSLFSRMPMDRRPRWDVDGGIWYVRQGEVPRTPEDQIARTVPTPMYRHKPTINSICEPLLGRSVRDAGGAIVGVQYPAFPERARIYREGIELVHVFRDYHDLFTLAMYRRYVCDHGIMMDHLFIELAEDAGFSPPQWEDLAVRMPEESPIRGRCEMHARTAKILAAE